MEPTFNPTPMPMIPRSEEIADAIQLVPLNSSSDELPVEPPTQNPTTSLCEPCDAPKENLNSNGTEDAAKPHLPKNRNESMALEQLHPKLSKLSKSPSKTPISEPPPR